MHTSNGKITDFVTNNGTPMKFTYSQLSVEDHLDGEHKFIDKDFPGEDSSLGPEPYDEKISWMRADEFMR